MHSIDLRKVFVQLLFSLTISQVALKYGDLVFSRIDFFTYPYAYMHLMLSAFVIISSWIGWHNTKSEIISRVVSNFISWESLIFVIDIILVINYFMLVRSAESPINNGSEIIQNASSYFEILWSMIIFIIYVFWDFITKFVRSEYTYRHQGEELIYNKKTKITTMPFFKRSAITFICAGITIYMFFCSDMIHEFNKTKVLFVDLILISVFYLFRSYKQKFNKIYKMDDYQFSDRCRIEIENLNPSVTYPINIEDSNSK